MGGGSWTTEVYREHEDLRARTGRSTFDHSDRMKRAPIRERKAHPTLEPLGVRVRESRDSVEHPESLAIAVHFDVTGSMSTLPEIFQKKLEELNGLLQRKGYVKHPQIMFGAIGDAVRGQDLVPLQIGQFESDNRMDDNLGNIYLEGSGGPGWTESYELAMYFMARHTDIDCWNLRRHKGYLFMIGDEMSYDEVKKEEVRRVIGDVLQENIPTPRIVSELRDRFEIYFILPMGANHGGSTEILGYWRRLLGQNVLELEDPEAVCETIALQIGINEGITDLEEGEEHLREFGSSRSTILAVRRALASSGGKLVVRGSDKLPGLRGDGTDEPKIKRL